MKIETPIPDFYNIAKKLLKDIPRHVGVTATNFFVESFHKQGFTDESFEPWQKRNAPDSRPGGAILTDTAQLRNSIHVLNSNESQITIGTYAAYAKIHNEGGTITLPITKKMRKYFWYMFKETQNSKWKWMALTKKNTMKITFPKRQFIGESKILMDNLETWLINEIEKRFKNLK